MIEVIFLILIVVSAFRKMNKPTLPGKRRRSAHGGWYDE